MRSQGEHELERIVTSHGDALVLVCSCGWVSAPARRHPAEAALRGHVRRAWARSAVPSRAALAATG